MLLPPHRGFGGCLLAPAWQDKMYEDAINAEEFSQLAHYTDIVVGGIACRKEAVSGGARLYIMTVRICWPTWGARLDALVTHRTL